MNTHNYTHGNNSTRPAQENIIDMKGVQALFYIIYTIIFVLGISGNLLVCFVVCRNRAMQTVTNLFITNLAVSDILLCVFAVTFTPLSAFRNTWDWGSILCRIMPFPLGCAVYVCTYTLMMIACDRFFVIIQPFRPRMQIKTCLTTIFFIWLLAAMVTMPYGYYMDHYELPGEGWFCEESWPSAGLRKAYGTGTIILQFFVPYTVMIFCYISVRSKLNERARAKAASTNARKEAIDQKRTRRTNQMLVAMIAIFGISWLPLNIVNVFNDYYRESIYLEFYPLIFLICHVTAMSSTVYNPIIYAWMNENFRKEFKLLFPCLDTPAPVTESIQLDPMGPAEMPLNRNTTTDSLGSSSQRESSFKNKRKPSATVVDVERSVVELDEDEDLIAGDVKHCHVSTSYNLRRESVQLHLINEESFDGTSSQSQV